METQLCSAVPTSLSLALGSGRLLSVIRICSQQTEMWSLTLLQYFKIHCLTFMKSNLFEWKSTPITSDLPLKNINAKYPLLFMIIEERSIRSGTGGWFTTWLLLSSRNLKSSLSIQPWQKWGIFIRSPFAQVQLKRMGPVYVWYCVLAQLPFIAMGWELPSGPHSKAFWTLCQLAFWNLF